MIINNDNLFHEVADGLRANDLDTIVACLIHTTRPDLQQLNSTHQLLLQRHMLMDFMGMQSTKDHEQIVKYIQLLEDQLDAALVGMFN